MQQRLNGGMPRELDSLAARLKLAREKRGFKQVGLAKASGLRQPDISKLEKGLILQTTAMARLAAALNVPAAWLELGLGDEPNWNSVGEPASPPYGFSDRREISDSDWGLLQDIRVVMSEEEIAAIRQRAANAAARYETLMRERATRGQGDRLAGGLVDSGFGDLEVSKDQPAKKKGGAK